VFNFDVSDMDECDRAVAVVKALMAVDENASIYVDMQTRSVEVTSAMAGAAEFLEAIIGAGFAPVLLHEAQPYQFLGRAPPEESARLR
jgi:hypothetical protein